MDIASTPTGKPIDLSKLQEKFPASEIEWRIGRAGMKDGKVWATALPYITNRAIMARLDEVCGPENWQNEFKEGPQGGVLCGLSIRVNGEWIRKWDGAENSDVESVKGGLSDAMKRAGYQWAIGRYLYDLPESWAVVDPKGEHVGVCKDASGKQVRFRWNPPKLPATALPPGEQPPQGKASGQKIEIVVHPKPPQKKADQEKKRASPAQRSYIVRLANQIGLDAEKELFAPRQLSKDTLSFAEAAALIDHLKALKPSPASKRKPLSEKEVESAERQGMRAA
jgi:hypothetical protein